MVGVIDQRLADWPVAMNIRSNIRSDLFTRRVMHMVAKQPIGLCSLYNELCELYR